MNPTTQRGRRVLKRTAGAFAVLLAFGAQAILAQLHTVTGTVTSAKDNSALPGVNIIEVGTQTGAMTDARGQFTLTVSNPNASIAVSFVGYLRQTVAVGGRSTVNVGLAEDVRMLEEVVVTSFGIERRERAVGFSVSKIDGAELAEIRETNIANSLAGKVAGVMVQKPATGSSGSSRVEIRGSSSLGGGQDNQPLYVVDGVPIDNTVLGQAGMWGGWDGGDGVSSLNPDDIENISVLKGPAAAALYGSRAKNGVILVTTKTAKAGTGLGIEFNSNTTFENILTNTDFQDVYGQGSRGVRPVTIQEARDTNTSAWGAKLDGAPTIQWDGVQRPYSMVENNLANFYQTGITSTNTLALSAATQQSATRFNVTHLTNQGLQPYSGLERTTFTMRSTANLGSKWTADAKLNFIREYVKNRPRLSDAPGNANYAVYSLAPNVGVQHMKCPIDPATGAPIPEEQCTPGVGLDGREYTIWDNIYAQNPWFAAHNMKQTDEDRRLIGFFSLQHKFTEWLSLMGRFGGDTYTTRRTNLEPYGLAYNTLGRLWEQEFRISEVNTDFLLIAERAFDSGGRTFGINATLGGNLLYRQREDLTLDGSGGFNVPTLVTVTNQRNPSIGYGFNEKQINSLYGSTELSYNDYLFLTLTARNDWSSTLPLDNNSYFYPSVGLSLVFSDILQMPSWVTFGKLRGSWAEVGGDTDPYQLKLTYALEGSAHLGQPRGFVAQGTIPLAGLKPSAQTGVEAGIDIRFFDNRLGVDFTYYDQSTANQILSTSISQTSGFGSAVINAGEMKNSGIELMVSTTPVRTPDFRWDFDVNIANNKNEVVSLAGEQTTLNLGEARSRNAFVVAEVGEPYGTLRGYKFLREVSSGDDPDDPCAFSGAIKHDASGFPLQTSVCNLGVGTPNVIGGISNTLRWKRLTLDMLIDLRFGGDLYSATNQGAYATGRHQHTLEYTQDDGSVWRREDGKITGAGVGPNGQPNTVAVDAQDYFGRLSGITDLFVYDASFAKLRELRLGYRLPDRWFDNTPVQMASISVVARNLLLLYSNIPNVDPESVFAVDNGNIGFEYYGSPQARSFGFNVNFRF